MIININGIWDAAVQQHVEYVSNGIDAALNALCRPEQHHEYLVEAFIKKHRAELLDPKETKFSLAINDFNAIFPPGSAHHTVAVKLLKKIFNYDGFRDATVGWNAYQLCSRAKYQVCPYCHLVHTPTVQPAPGVKGCRPDLDHFFSRSEYPFLALSLGNLIPCCSFCNGPMIKHGANFFAVPHLHPQADTEQVKFVLEARDPSQRAMPDFRAFRRPASDYYITISNPINCQKTAASIVTFKLQERYAPLVGQAYQVARMARNRSGWVHSVLERVGIRLTPKHYLEFDPYTETYRHHATGKLRRDVFLQSL